MQRPGSKMSRQHDQLERLTFFSDAVFAIAMTLLVVEVRLPHVANPDETALANALLSLFPEYVGFLVSFLVLGRFWIGHHTLMGVLDASSPRLVRTNLAMLLAVAFMPFPTAVVSQYGGMRVGIGFYAGWLLLLGLLNRRLIAVANDPALLAPDIDRAEFRQHRTRALIPIAIGLSSLVAGIIAPRAGLIVLMIGSPLVTVALNRRAARLNRG